MSNFYDVVVVGTQLGSLAAGALLSRRGFRVLVLGHDELPGTYSYTPPGGAELRLPRAPFTVVAADAPPLRRLLQELALSQLFRRRAREQEPFFQVVLPRHRVDVFADGEELSRELTREWAEVARQIEAFYATLTRHNADLDRVFAKDLVWPPESFFERRELARAATQSPFGRDGQGPDPLADLPEGHPFRLFVHAQVRFAGCLDPRFVSALLLTRLHGAWMRGTLAPEGGVDGLKRLLFEKVGMHSGEVRERERVEGFVVRGGRVTGVRVAGQDEIAGCNFVVWGGAAASLLELLPAEALPRKASERLAGLEVVMRRHVLNVVIDREGLPVGMGRDLYSLLDPQAPLAGHNLLHLQVDSPAGASHHVLTVETLLPTEHAASLSFLSGYRELVLEHLRVLVPFLDEHALLVDSPCDDRPLEDLVGKTTALPEDRALRGIDRMEPIWAVSEPGALGITGLPSRIGPKNVLLAGRETVPGLGFEGPFLTAWSVARLITRTDRKKERMRRELWAKIEI